MSVPAPNAIGSLTATVPSGKMPKSISETQRRKERQRAAADAQKAAVDGQINSLTTKIQELANVMAELKAENNALRKKQESQPPQVDTRATELLAATNSPQAQPALEEIGVLSSQIMLLPPVSKPHATKNDVFDKTKFDLLIKTQQDINNLRNNAKMLRESYYDFEAVWVYEKTQQMIKEFNIYKEVANSWFKDYWSGASSRYKDTYKKSNNNPERQLVHQFNEHQMHYRNMILRFSDATKEINPLSTILNAMTEVDEEATKQSYLKSIVYTKKPKFAPLELVTVPTLAS